MGSARLHPSAGVNLELWITPRTDCEPKLPKHLCRCSGMRCDRIQHMSGCKCIADQRASKPLAVRRQPVDVKPWQGFTEGLWIMEEIVWKRGSASKSLHNLWLYFIHSYIRNHMQHKLLENKADTKLQCLHLVGCLLWSASHKRPRPERMESIMHKVTHASHWISFTSATFPSSHLKVKKIFLLK